MLAFLLDRCCADPALGTRWISAENAGDTRTARISCFSLYRRHGRFTRMGFDFRDSRHIDTPLAAYIGESVVLRYDPRDAAEVRVFYNDCRFHLNRRLRGRLIGAQSTF